MVNWDNATNALFLAIISIGTASNRVSAYRSSVKLTRANKQLETVKTAVHTANGSTVGQLLEAQEGRDIQRNVPAGEQTSDQKGYVERGIAAGNLPSGDPSGLVNGA
jgi:hypothetical protein